jgi:hypothetical protein
VSAEHVHVSAEHVHVVAGHVEFHPGARASGRGPCGIPSRSTRAVARVISNPIQEHLHGCADHVESHPGAPSCARGSWESQPWMGFVDSRVILHPIVMGFVRFGGRALGGWTTMRCGDRGSLPRQREERHLAGVLERAAAGTPPRQPPGRRRSYQPPPRAR